jgi:alpha-L-rhamnosidase
MIITDLKINNIECPMGYAFDSVKAGWKVKQARGTQAELARIEVAGDADFRELLYTKEGKFSGVSELLEFERKPRTRYYYRVEVTDNAGDHAVSEPSWFETGKMDEPWSGAWITPSRDDTFHPVFHKQFRKEKEVARARLYISGLGMYAAWLNQERVGAEVLTPYYSNYHFETQYQTFDVTSLLKEENELEIYLGNGWYKGRFGLSGGPSNNFGDRFKLICELHLMYTDGSEEVIASDPSWKYRESFLLGSDIYDGEIQDRNRPKTQEMEWRTPELTAIEGKLTERYSLPVKEKEDLPVKEVIHTPAGECVLDFGQNFAGYVAFYAKLPKGCRIVLDFGEILQNGNFYRENYRSAKSQFVYVSDGEARWVRPLFTYFGFRYVRVTGWIGEVHAQDFVGKALYSDLHQTGFLKTGHKGVNQLFSNTLWGQKSNSIDFPTDCPQRDERLGWTGDAQVFAATASFNMDTAAFYHKFLHDLRTEQLRFDGIVPGVIPVLREGAEIFASVWGDAATIIPWVLYEQFGDLDALRTYYPMMKDWVDRIEREDAKRGAQYLWNFGRQLGDWLALDGRTAQSMKGGTDEYFLASCYWAESTRKVSAAAAELGYEADKRYYEALYQKIREAILEEYFTVKGRLAIDTQTAYLTALNFGIYREKQPVIDGLKHRMYMDLYRITSGFVGAPVMCRVLAENGMEEEALRVLLNKDYPGWLHCIELGATTIWERWNSVLDDGTISGTTMNSLNHYAYGSVVEYLYKDLAGLRAIRPGFQKIHFRPYVTAQLGFMECQLETVHGTYRTAWKLEPDGSVSIQLEIPFGCSAAVELPFDPDGTVREEGPGVHTYHYHPTKDLTCAITEDTLFREMMELPHFLETIRPISGFLFQVLSSGDEEYLAESLRTLREKEFMGFHKEKVDRLKEVIIQLAEGGK